MSRRNATGGAAATTAAVFGEVLKHYREAAPLTQDALAARIPCDRSQIARVEAGTRVPQDVFAQKCDELLGTGGVLLRLWSKIDWYPNVEHPDWFKRRAEMDAEAVAVRAYQTQVMPGLLQSEPYAQALFSDVADDAEAEERVRARLSRQQRFLDPAGPLYIVVLDESCLRNVVGSPTVMRDQCAHLLTMGQRPNIRIQVAPAHHPKLIRPKTSMSLISMPDGHDWVYSESLNRGHFQDDPAVYARHSRAYDVLRADALSAGESAALISDVMEGYERHGVDQEQLQRPRRRRLHRNSPRYPRRRPRP
ncbi:Scr1 family TA system antitoxin-like transcriptional regulator [Streptomyces sp. NPDC047928]|uniref:helix-turn-helix domain-containing protein n=1 Tax=unclassified Streptomyces TaxID=2593676 RepID=UPI003711B48D